MLKWMDSTVKKIFSGLKWWNLLYTKNRLVYLSYLYLLTKDRIALTYEKNKPKRSFLFNFNIACFN